MGEPRPDARPHGHRLGQLSAHAGNLPLAFGAEAAAPAAACNPVNSARGEIVDEEELVRLLEIRAIGGAGLDVFEHEPAVDPRLQALDNVVLLPHMGSATIEGRIAMGEKVIINIKTFADGHRPPDRVIGSML